MRKQILLVILLGLCFTASSQTPTKFYKEGKAPALHPKAELNRATIPIKRMPAVNNEKLLQRDSIRGKMDVPFRFGKGFEVDFSLKDGKWRETRDGRVWNLKIRSKGAYSINLILDELHLPKGGELHLYNENRDVMYGPVTASQNTPPQIRIS
jgi:hypothetical protein